MHKQICENPLDLCHLRSIDSNTDNADATDDQRSKSL